MLLTPDHIAEHVVDATLFCGRCDPAHHSIIALLITLNPEARALRDTFAARLGRLLGGAETSTDHFLRVRAMTNGSNGGGERLTP